MVTSPFDNKGFVKGAKFYDIPNIFGFNKMIEATGLPETSAQVIQNIDATKNTVTNLYNFPFVDVVTCGAKGNGVTDDTAAFDTAVSQLPDGGCLYLPKGTYNINNWPVNKYCLRIIGETPKMTRHQNWFTGNKATTLRLNANSALVNVSDHIQSVSFENIVFDGSGYTGPLVNMYRNGNIHFKDCTFLWGKPAIHAEATIQVSLYNCNFWGCGSATVPIIYLFNGTMATEANCSDWHFFSCFWERLHGHIIEFDSTGAGTVNRSFYFYGPRTETKPNLEGTIAGLFLTGTANFIHIFGGSILQETKGVTTTSCVSITSDSSCFSGTRFNSEDAPIIITGDNNRMIGLNTHCSTAVANIQITGDKNKVIGTALTYLGTPCSLVGGHNTDIGNGTQAVTYGAAAPAAGAWARGAICFNTEPSASGTPGWVCVAAGTPGTWKAMSSLAA